jgi:hypothetical protein
VTRAGTAPALVRRFRVRESEERRARLIGTKRRLSYIQALRRARISWTFVVAGALNVRRSRSYCYAVPVPIRSGWRSRSPVPGAKRAATGVGIPSGCRLPAACVREGAKRHGIRARGAARWVAWGAA